MNESKKEWDNYPKEIYDKLKNLGWHVHIVDRVVLSAISPNADYVYTYCKGAKQELKIFTKLPEEDNKFFKGLLDNEPNKDTETNKDVLMWNFDHH